jgi:dimethylhistidine N-methyltransferase
LLGEDEFNLIELGPGEGIKTQLLIEQFLADSLHFNYIPIDISAEYLHKLLNQFNRLITGLTMTPIHSDYFRGLKWINTNAKRRNLVLFLGSSIGNFDPIAVKVFLSHLHDALQDGDYVLLGFDLRKDIDILLRAYNDSAGLTREFNLNLLKRLNRELGANFKLEKFRHYPTYNVYSGAMESYLISLEAQIVAIKALARSFTFEAIEPIHVEYSYKYMLPQIEEFAQLTGFKTIENFTDSRGKNKRGCFEANISNCGDVGFNDG